MTKAQIQDICNAKIHNHQIWFVSQANSDNLFTMGSLEIYIFYYYLFYTSISITIPGFFSFSIDDKAQNILLSLVFEILSKY